MKELYIDRGITQSRLAVFEDGKITELYIENHDNKNITGNIYKGRVENIVPGLGAAFVNIGIGKNAILHFDEIEKGESLKKGQEIIVQVIREASGDKGPRLSGKISIPGKYIVLLPGTNYINISKKVNDDSDRKRLQSIANRIFSKGFGFIIRTEANSAEEYEITEEYMLLIEMWKNASEFAVYSKSPKIIFNIRNFLSLTVREYIKKDIENIYVNRSCDRDMLINLLKRTGTGINSHVIYDEYDFSKAAKLEKEIIKALETKKPLPSGGYIVVDITEALTTIDVNTGSSKNGGDHDTFVFNTNIEACSEIYNTIRLANLSGIIIIDFIDMKKSEHREQVLDTLRDMFKKDRTQNRLYGFTKLAFLEMSRAKKGKRLNELIYKDASNKAYNTAYVLKLIENQCVRLSKHYNKNKFYIYTAPYLMDDISKDFSHFSSEMKSIYNIQIEFIKSKYISDYKLADEKDEDVNFIKVEMGSRTVFGRIIDLTENEDSILLKIKKSN